MRGACKDYQDELLVNFYVINIYTITHWNIDYTCYSEL